MAVVQKGKRWLRGLGRSLLAGLLSLSLLGCADARSVRVVTLPDMPTVDAGRLSGAISKVAPPAVFLDLANLMGDVRPEVAIAYPEPDQVIEATALTAKLTLRALSIYKDEATALGPHLQVILDNQLAQSIYSLDDPIEFTDLAPGSHTLRVLAVQPWGESFKNETAYAQTTFHVLAETGANRPDSQEPVLTYVEPQGTYGAEPILLDFYLSNAPLHLIAQESPDDDIPDWQIRCRVNGQSFVFDQWQPVYLKGFKPGQNWVQIALEDKQGHPIDNVFNSTVRLVTYDPEQRDPLAKIVRGELPLKQIGQIADPNYEPLTEPIVPPEPEPEEAIQLGPEDEPLDLSDELEPLGVPAEEKPSQIPDDISDFNSAADGSVEASEEPLTSPEEPAAERPAVDLTKAEPATPTDIPDTLTSPSADDASAAIAPSDSADADNLDASSADEAPNPVAQ